MHYIEFGRRDATIYSGGTTASINTGFDEILEVNKVVNDDGTIGNVRNWTNWSDPRTSNKSNY